MVRRGRTGGVVLTGLALLTGLETGWAQEPARPDTIPADTVPADSPLEAVPDSVREALGLQEPERRRVASFPSAPSTPARARTRCMSATRTAFAPPRRSR